jgi:uncharacterized protein (TIGR02246 family)
MTRRAVAALLIVIASWAPARAEDVRKAVESRNRAFVGAFLRGDAKAISELYTEDAKVIPPGGEVVNGRAAIAEFWRKQIGTGVKDLTLSTGTVEAVGDLAYEDGIVKQVAKDGKVITGRYVVVWKRHDGGSWKLHRDIWN